MKVTAGAKRRERIGQIEERWIAEKNMSKYVLWKLLTNWWDKCSLSYHHHHHHEVCHVRYTFAICGLLVTTWISSNCHWPPQHSLLRLMLSYISFQTENARQTRVLSIMVSADWGEIWKLSRVKLSSNIVLMSEWKVIKSIINTRFDIAVALLHSLFLPISPSWQFYCTHSAHSRDEWDGFCNESKSATLRSCIFLRWKCSK